MDKDRCRRTIGYPTKNTQSGENAMSRTLRTALFVAAIAVVSAIAPAARAQEAVTLHGAVQFNDDHAFNKALLRFEQLVKQ
jgi:TRAP-type C4-dicarboxylate transport system substrate-binding protein